jgi:hypothetical protein
MAAQESRATARHFDEKTVLDSAIQPANRRLHTWDDPLDISLVPGIARCQLPFLS